MHSSDTRAFLRQVLRTAARRVDVLRADSSLWRAQKGGCTIEVPIPDTDDDYYVDDRPYPTERMKPLVGRASEGRANPKGIPYLYLATHPDTAVAEVRPWKGGVVSVGNFRPSRELRLVNTTLHTNQVFHPFSKQPETPRYVEEWVWADINAAYSAPTQQSDDTSEYVPTQVLSELFFDAGFDGVGYRSAYGEGHNIVLFDLSLAEHMSSHIVKVADISFSLERNTQFGYQVKARSTAT